MSLKAMVWALEQDIYSASQKFVLVVYANFASETGMSYPSLPTVSRMTSHKVDTVRGAVAALVKGGYLLDTGKRAGATQQVKVYQFPDQARDLKTPEKGSLKDSPKDSPKDPRKRGSEPITYEPSTPPNPLKGEVELMELPEKLRTARMLNRWQVWMNMRQSKRKPKNWAVMFNAQIEMLSCYAEPVAFEILSASVRGNWQGLFRPKGDDGKATATDGTDPETERLKKLYPEAWRDQQEAMKARRP